MGLILSGLGKLATSGVGRSALGKLLPLAADLGVIAGVGTGLTAGAGYASNKLGLNDALGLSAEKVARGEAFDVNKQNEDGSYGALKGWDIGDDFRSLVTGVKKEDVLKQKRSQVQSAIQNAEDIKLLTSEIKRRGGALGLEGLDTTYTHDMKGKGAFTDKLNAQREKIAKLESLKAIPGSDLTGLSMQSSNADIDRAIQTATTNYQRAEASKEGGTIYEARRAEERSDNRAAIAAAREKHQFDQNLAMQNHQFNERMRQRDADRVLSRELAGDKIDLAMLDRQTAREDLKFRREEAAASRRQQQMMMLIKGMTQLGAGFAL